MVRSKNKPKKNAAAASPAAIPTGTTEVIAPTFIQTPIPTFTQIGMAGMIGMLSTPPTFAEPAVTGVNGEVNGFAVTNPTVAEQTTAVAEQTTAVAEPKTEQLADAAAEEPKAEETTPAEPTQSTGIFGFFRRFYNSLGGAIHR